MMGRRTAAMLCVLLGHALLVLMLIDALRPKKERQVTDGDRFFFDLIEIPTEAVEAARLPEPRSEPRLRPPRLPDGSAQPEEEPTAGESAAITLPDYVDWPKEGKEAATRVLKREAEAERIAKMFAGPQGTSSALTRKQQAELNHFRWKPGVNGLERDANGNTILHISDRCVLVNFLMIGCALGAKPPAYGDLFKDMRLYFDEQRRPEAKEEPPTWVKPKP